MSDLSTENLDALVLKAKEKIATPITTYEEKDGAIVLNRNKDYQQPLCNFTAHIASEEIHDDGAEKKLEFVINGRSSDGKVFTPAVVSSDKYAGMAWINANWGTRALVYAGTTLKDHLRVAIQSLSGEVAQKTIYTHLGWRKISEKWVYLHGEGAIGESGLDNSVQVSPQGELKSYILPPPPMGRELQESIRASLSLLYLAPLRISAPLLGAIYRAPLGEAYDIDLSVFLSGSSGCQKSECTAMAQAHFGKNFSRTKLPGNWISTGNSLERLAFLAKDAVFTVDDFAPTGTATDVARLHKEADRLFRGQGNKAGRGRLTADARSRPQYYPRGLIISSGEDVPKGSSVRARVLILEMCRGDVDLNALTAMQNHAALGNLAKSMAGYIQWAAPRIDRLKADLPARHFALRAQIGIGNSHARTPDLVINLALGIECFLQYALDSEAISATEKDELWNECWKALQESGTHQAEFQIGEEVTSKFFELIGSALISGKAHLVDSKTGHTPCQGERYGWRPEGSVIRTPHGDPEPEYWRAMGDKIGWIDMDDILLNPGAAFACAQEIARKQNDSIPTSAKVLWKRLVQKGLVIKGESGKNLCKRTVEGMRLRVLVLSNKGLPHGFRNGGNGGSEDTTSPAEAFRPQKVSPKFEAPEKWGRNIGAATHDCQGSVPLAPTAPIPVTVSSQINLIEGTQ